jgi:hypothetical protein
MTSSKNNISYVVGEQYAILSIPTKEAQRHGIDNAKQVIIQTTKNGITIKKAVTGDQPVSSPQMQKDRDPQSHQDQVILYGTTQTQD